MSNSAKIRSNLPSELFLQSANEMRNNRCAKKGNTVLGKPCRQGNPSTNILRAVSLVHGKELQPDEVKFYNRCSWNHLVLTSKSYTLQKKRNNFTVCFNNSNNVKRFGEINTFCTVEGKIWVIIDTMDTSSNAFINSETTANTSHIHKGWVKMCPWK